MSEEPTQGMSRGERLYGMLCHLLALGFFILPLIGQILGPLIVWLIKKEEYPFVDEQGKESLNFQLSITIYSFVATILVITIPLLLIIGAFWLVEVIIASVRANDGISYRYPLTIRFIK
ncbi:MAG: DUF4870 domain-containing protein [Armatimonadota bacterium]|jgi:uncharacterized Tic20 family protein|nr:DUF4870 domain-containing protein [Armatimonadota bacterium]